MPYVPADAFVVNTTTADTQDHSRVVYLESGGFVIVWSDRSQSGTQSTDLRGQAYDSTGTAAGDEFQIGATAGDQTGACVAPLPGGGFIIAWSDSFAGEVWAQIFDPDGDEVGAEFRVSNAGRVSHIGDIAALDSGNVVIVWEQQVASNDPVTPGILAQQFDATGARIGPAAGIADYLGDIPHVSAMASGGFVVSWTINSPFEDYPSVILSHAFDSNSARVGDHGQANSPSRLKPDDHAVAGLENGGYVLAWAAMTQGGDTDPDVILAQLFDADGDPVGTPFEVNSTTAGSLEHQPAVIAVPGMGFAVAWRDLGEFGGSSPAAVRVQFFTDDGIRIGEEFVATPGSSGGGRPHLAANSDGELIVTWTDELGATLDIVARIFVPEVQMGGPGDDRYIVDNPNERVIEAPGEGYDVIFTYTNYTLDDDSEVEGLSTITWELTDPIKLTGNGLDNQLFGNAGRNRLDGGGGNDVMYGREGNDTYVVDSAGDRPIEAAGQGSDVVYTSVSYSLNDSSEIESLSTIPWEGTTAIDLTGNSLANHLFGNDGANQLNGKAGADTMIGRAGNDKYFVDNAGDRAFESVGGGTDLVFTSVSYTLTDGQEIESLSTITWELTNAIDLTGNGLANQLFGNAGANRLDGRGGNDVLHGKGGADIFAFTTVLGANNVDIVHGFSAADDTIALENNGVFVGLSGGALPASAFVIGTAAQDAGDRIVYDQATGRLFFDADGSGSGAQVQFAVLAGAPIISASDFTVI